MYQPWAKSLNGGRLDIFRGDRIQLHLPLDANAVVTPAHNPCADFTGGTGNVGPIGFAPPDGTRAPAPSRAQLLRYQEALAPVVKLVTTTSAQLRQTHFNEDFAWSWKAVGNQIGNPAQPAAGQYYTNSITVTSHVSVTLTR